MNIRGLIWMIIEGYGLLILFALAWYAMGTLTGFFMWGFQNG